MVTNMIFPSLYEELDMERYATLAINMLAQRKVTVVLCDNSGKIIWSNDNENNITNFLSRCNKQISDMVTSDGCTYEKITFDNINTAYFDLGDLVGDSAGNLVFYDVGDTVNGKIDFDAIVSMLSGIAELVKAELNYIYEVNAMARELGERYDELSMLRASDLKPADYHESRHILSTYIRSCGDHLNVDYAAIWVSSRNSIHPGGVSYKRESTEILALLERLSIAAFAMFQAGDDGFGINDKDEGLRRVIDLPADKKVLIIPVLDEKSKPRGVLICLNEFYNKDFTNSDKSTLEAVAHKTHKYLLSTQDELTGLLNRKGFEEILWREVAQIERERYLVLINIDQFRVVNAAYGMTTGNVVLTSLAETISRPDLGIKFTARLDADVFAVLIESPKSEIENRVSKVCDEIDAMVIPADGKNLSVKSRAGVIALGSKETAIADHFYAAELALVSAKEESNNHVVVYHPGNTALLKRKHQLAQVENIKNALEEDRFVLYCQRIAPLSGEENHYEILVRMIDESGDLVQPDDFIPVAERYNLMSSVDRWVIKHTFQLLQKEEFHDLSSNFKWGINLSGTTIGDPDFHDYVSSCLREYDFSPTNLYFEITETAAIKNFKNCVSFMNKIHSLGVQFALDDFGSGLSSFSYLKKLSIDYLKIDGSLVKDIVSCRLDQTMVSAIADIAKVLGVKTIAEYVENDSILEVLEGLSIDYAQGYGIMKPQAVEIELKSLLEESECKIYSKS